MQALVKSRAGGGLWLEDVPVPEIGIRCVNFKKGFTAMMSGQTGKVILDWRS